MASEEATAAEGKLFVGGVPVGTTEEELREHFAAFGRVLVVGVPKHKTTGNPRGFAFVQFARPEDADRALAAARHRHVVNGAQLDVKVAEPRVPPKGEEECRSSGNLPLPIDHHPSHKKKIFVGGLLPTVDDEQLGDYFRAFGDITYAVVVTDMRTKLSRRFGYVAFVDEEAAGRAMEKERHFLGGSWVEVKRAISRPVADGGGGGGSEQLLDQAAEAASGRHELSLSAHAAPYWPSGHRITNGSHVMNPASMLCYVDVNAIAARRPSVGYAVLGYLAEPSAGGGGGGFVAHQPYAQYSGYSAGSRPIFFAEASNT